MNALEIINASAQSMMQKGDGVYVPMEDLDEAVQWLRWICEGRAFLGINWRKDGKTVACLR
jgi:hypothetical protein